MSNLEFTTIIRVPKNNIKIERNGLVTISSKASLLFNEDHIIIHPTRDYSMIVLRPDPTGRGIRLSKTSNYTRVRFNSSKLLKGIVKHIKNLPDDYRSIKFELKIEDIGGQKEVFFTTGKDSECFIA